MLGIGKWKFYVDAFMYKGNIIIDISSVNGNYSLTPIIPDVGEQLTYELLETKASGNTLHVVAAASLLPGNKTVAGDLTFEGDKCLARFNVPFIGNLQIEGVRVD